MTEIDKGQVWASGAQYEPYVGRWSRVVAREFLKWLAVPPDKFWLDVGCGTGALTQTILATASPREVKGIDPSQGYVDYARQQTNDPRASFKVGDALSLPFDASSFDAAVSGLVLNFVPDAVKAIAQQARVTRGIGVIAAYVWDYAGEMQLMRHFWNAACELDPAACELDEGVRYKICKPEPLTKIFRDAGLNRVETRAIDAPTVFRDFEDYWSPFLGGQGPAPSYAMSLSEERRAALRERIRVRLPIRPDGSIHLIARAWACRATR